MQVDCLDTESVNFGISFVAKKVDFSKWIANVGYLCCKTLVETRHLYFLSCGSKVNSAFYAVPVR